MGEKNEHGAIAESIAAEAVQDIMSGIYVLEKVEARSLENDAVGQLKDSEDQRKTLEKVVVGWAFPMLEPFFERLQEAEEEANMGKIHKAFHDLMAAEKRLAEHKLFLAQWELGILRQEIAELKGEGVAD